MKCSVNWGGFLDEPDCDNQAEYCVTMDNPSGKGEVQLCAIHTESFVHNAIASKEIAKLRDGQLVIRPLFSGE